MRICRLQDWARYCAACRRRPYFLSSALAWAARRLWEAVNLVTKQDSYRTWRKVGRRVRARQDYSPADKKFWQDCLICVARFLSSAFAVEKRRQLLGKRDLEKSCARSSVGWIIMIEHGSICANRPTTLFKISVLPTCDDDLITTRWMPSCVNASMTSRVYGARDVFHLPGSAASAGNMR